MIKMKCEIQSADGLLKGALGYGLACPELCKYNRRTGDGGDTCG
jgi:hypothetical protein